MKTQKLIIAGAFYYDEKNDTLLSPHYTGEFSIVDCNEYKRMNEIEDSYDENYINQIKDNPIKYNGNKYYDAEYSPCVVNDWELLSDLSDFSYLEENYDFN